MSAGDADTVRGKSMQPRILTFDQKKQVSILSFTNQKPRKMFGIFLTQENALFQTKGARVIKKVPQETDRSAGQETNLYEDRYVGTVGKR